MFLGEFLDKNVIYIVQQIVIVYFLCFYLHLWHHNP